MNLRVITLSDNLPFHFLILYDFTFFSLKTVNGNFKCNYDKPKKKKKFKTINPKIILGFNMGKFCWKMILE